MAQQARVQHRRHLGVIQNNSSDLSAADWALLEACAPLAELGAANRHAVIAGSRVIAAPDGTVILQQGDRGEAFYVLLSGSVELLRRGATAARLPSPNWAPAPTSASRRCSR